MVSGDEPTDQTPLPRAYDDSGDDHSPSRRYDSFVVRLWRDGSSSELLRAEVEHVQTGLRIDKVQTSLGWILSAIKSWVQPSDIHQIEGASQSDDTPSSPHK